MSFEDLLAQIDERDFAFGTNCFQTSFVVAKAEDFEVC
jgi:hypothetical protein